MLQIDQLVTFDSHVAAVVELKNFSEPEEEAFVWSNGRWSELTFDLDIDPETTGAGRFEMELDLSAFRHAPVLNGQNLFVYVNGVRVKSAYITDRTLLRCSLGAAPLWQRQNVVTLDLPDARPATEFGVQDDRMLGVQLFSMVLRPEF